MIPADHGYLHCALSPVPEINTAATHHAPYNRRLDRLSADLDAKGYSPAPARHRGDS